MFVYVHVSFGWRLIKFFENNQIILLLADFSSTFLLRAIRADPFTVGLSVQSSSPSGRLTGDFGRELISIVKITVFFFFLWRVLCSYRFAA